MGQKDAPEDDGSPDASNAKPITRGGGATSSAPVGDAVPTKVVLLELLEAETALTRRQLCERTLLPATKVQLALSELERAGLLSISEDEPRRYSASL